MKENKKAILEILKKKSKKDGKFESLVLNLALQKIDSDSFEFYDDAVYTADKKRLVYCMSQAESFHIPEGVTTIGEMAFRGKKQLKNIIIANSVKEIEHDAFYDCDELDNVYVPAGVKEIKSYAFAECDKLKKITFAGVPDKLSRHTFDDCDLLHDIIVPAGTSKTFRKALHFTDGDTDFLVLEKPADNATVAPSAPQQEQKKGNKNRMLQKTRSKTKQTRNKTRKLQTKQTRSKTRKLQTSKNRNRSKNNQKQSNRAVVLTPQTLL